MEIRDRVNLARLAGADSRGNSVSGEDSAKFEAFGTGFPRKNALANNSRRNHRITFVCRSACPFVMEW